MSHKPLKGTESIDLNAFSKTEPQSPAPDFDSNLAQADDNDSEYFPPFRYKNWLKFKFLKSD